MILREILTKFGFKVESAPLEKYNGLVKNAISTMIGFKLAQIDIIGGVKDLITGMASLSKEIVYGAQRMGPAIRAASTHATVRVCSRSCWPHIS